MDKKEIRKQVLQQREKLGPELRLEKSTSLVERILSSSMYQQATCIFTFIPFGHEVDIRPIIDHCIAHGKKIAIPKTYTSEKYMIPYSFTSWSKLIPIPGVYGILEPDPAKEEEINPDQIDLILVPGVAFDRKGGRLGYGGGFYDRFLANYKKVPLLTAVCFQEQIIDTVPMAAHDFRVDFIITDGGVINCQI